MRFTTGQAIAALTFTFALLMSTPTQARSAAREGDAAPMKLSYEIEQQDINCEVIEAAMIKASPAPVEPGRYEKLLESMTDKDKALTALTIYHESRGESYEGQRAVAEVIFNRVLSERWPATATDVIYQKGQFACSGALTTSAIREPDCLATAFEVMEDVLREKEYALPAHYCFFQTGKPRTEDHIKIGNHYFY